jgi:sugar O-acyltransferase (sialic acid O-acetyltransferase NeuD family)
VSRRLLILGAGAHSRAVADLAGEAGWTVAGFTDRGDGLRTQVLGTDRDIGALARAGTIDAGVVGVGNSSLERRAELWALLRECGLPTPTLVHPRAIVSRSSRVGDGCVIFGGCVLGAGVELGVNGVFYSGVIAEHGCRVGDHCYLSPGVVLSGDVTIERSAFLGAGAVVVPGVRIGAGAVVAAGAVVVDDVPPRTTVIGVPARAREARR